MPAKPGRRGTSGSGKTLANLKKIAEGLKKPLAGLTSVIMREADRALGEAGRALAAEFADISAEPLISGSYCATECHGEVGVKVPPETVRVPDAAGVPALAGKTMPHKSHTGMLGCVKCHDIGGHKSVPLRKDYRETCKGCHQE